MRGRVNDWMKGPMTRVFLVVHHKPSFRRKRWGGPQDSQEGRLQGSDPGRVVDSGGRGEDDEGGTRNGMEVHLPSVKEKLTEALKSGLQTEEYLEHKRKTILGGMGLKHDDYLFFRDTLEEHGALSRSIVFMHTAADPIVECLLVPDISLAVAENFALEILIPPREPSNS
jgi:hypothetical protein